MFEIFLCQRRHTGSNDSDLVFAASSPALFHLQGVRGAVVVYADKIALRLPIFLTECAVIYEDEHLLAVNKPPGLPTLNEIQVIPLFGRAAAEGPTSTLGCLRQ